MKTSQFAVVTALFLGLVSTSFAGPGAEYFQRRAKKTEAPSVTTGASTDKKTAARVNNPGCCRDTISYKPGPSGKTTTRVVKHECSCTCTVS